MDTGDDSFEINHNDSISCSVILNCQYGTESSLQHCEGGLIGTGNFHYTTGEHLRVVCYKGNNTVTVSLLCAKINVYAVCTDRELRLVDGLNYREGTVEVCMDGRWGAFCANSQKEIDVCSQLGFPPGLQSIN